MLAKSMLVCQSGERHILKKNIDGMLQRVSDLLGGKAPQPEPEPKPKPKKKPEPKVEADGD